MSLPEVEGLAVEQAEVRLVRLRLRAPHRAAHGEISARPTVLVRLRMGGVDGWGECPALPRPTYTAEYAVGAFAVVRDQLLPALLGRVPGEPGDLHLSVVGHPMAHAAIADAILDAALRHEGRSLAAALGATRRVLMTRAVVTADAIDPLVAEVGEEVARGARFVGIKVSSDRPHEVAAAVRAAFPDVRLSIDGNGRLGQMDDATWRRLDRLELDEVEQPCPPGDWLGSARVAGCLGCPVVLDEGISSAADVRTAAVLGAGQVVNVKPARVGGVQAALGVARAAAALGLGTFVGGMLESGVGRAAALALAAAVPGDRPTHLRPSAAYWLEDITEPLTGDAACVDVPDGAGIGRTPDAHALDELTVERFVIDS